MEGLKRKKVGQLVISSDYVATADAVATYVESVSADLQAAIDGISINGYVPLSSLQGEVLKIISANYQTVVDYLDGRQDDQIIVGGGSSIK